MKKLWSRWKIEWNSTSIDRKIELFFIIGGIVIAALVLINGGKQLEQMATQTSAMKAQLAEMKSGGEDTKAIAEAAKAQADSTKSLAESAADTANTSKISMVASTRAYVHNSGFRWISHPDKLGDIYWRIRPQWINIGNTPTRELRIYTHYELRDSELPTEYSFNSGEFVPTTIHPKGVIEPRFFNIKGTDLLAVMHGRKYLYIWGIARYRDIFPGTSEHITKFLVVAGNITGNPLRPYSTPGNPLDIEFLHYGMHDCADEDCDKKK